MNARSLLFFFELCELSIKKTKKKNKKHALTTKERVRPTPWLHSTVSYRGDSLRNHLCLRHCYRRGYFGKKIISWDAREKCFGGRGGMCVGVSVVSVLLVKVCQDRREVASLGNCPLTHLTFLSCCNIVSCS